MIRIASVTVKLPHDRLSYAHNQIVTENGGYRQALFKHVATNYAMDNGSAKLVSVRYERAA